MFVWQCEKLPRGHDITMWCVTVALDLNSVPKQSSLFGSCKWYGYSTLTCVCVVMYHGWRNIWRSTFVVLLKMCMRCPRPAAGCHCVQACLWSTRVHAPLFGCERACGQFVLIKPLNKLSGQHDSNQQLASVNSVCVCVCAYTMCLLAVPEHHYYLRESVALYGEEK